MNLTELKERPNLSDHIKLSRVYDQLSDLISALKSKELPHSVIASVSQDIEEINSTSSIHDELKRLVKKKQSRIIKFVEKEVKIVPKNYYRNLWLALGMSVFGLPLGVAFGLSMGNLGLLALGLPVGMAIGIAVGSGMDKKAFEEGRQLDIEMKY